MFLSIYFKQEGHVTYGDNNKGTILGRGSIGDKDILVIHDVLYVEGLKPMSDLSLCWRGLMSISNVGVYDINIRRLTNSLVSVFGPAHLMWPLPLSDTSVRCLRSVTRIDDRGLVGKNSFLTPHKNFLLLLASVCLCECTVYKQISEGIITIWIQNFVEKRRKRYTCAQ